MWKVEVHWYRRQGREISRGVRDGERRICLSFQLLRLGMEYLRVTQAHTANSRRRGRTAGLVFALPANTSWSLEEPWRGMRSCFEFEAHLEWQAFRGVGAREDRSARSATGRDQEEIWRRGSGRDSQRASLISERQTRMLGTYTTER
nr:hypothetical protein CFP56_66868 [Quercus suber]